ncbi:hypothetical protein TRIUR3_23269 [Triticum urartu]|uniref:Protein kinase domain-containing protein n=1 Tax=Triticum urartu TaxID=4572 RepID=M7Z991_TRIUA|nr:hypothetical protein TRIUR3_23269 [Triticum urartu]
MSITPNYFNTSADMATTTTPHRPAPSPRLDRGLGYFFINILRRRRGQSAGSGDVHHSGDLFSRDLSTTTSMRGTVCYVAPEGDPLEKADVYSFGVLVLGSYDRGQATLCAQLALMCLQRQPEHRPDSTDIVKILAGEMELPPAPVEFSPSPQLRRPFPRSSHRAQQDATG